MELYLGSKGVYATVESCDGCNYYVRWVYLNKLVQVVPSVDKNKENNYA
jgi:formate dehydrogenase maturation protein FdhE